MIVKPLRGLRPKDELASKIASPPYDVVSTDEARQHARDPYSFLHVVRPEIDLAPDVHPYDEAVYRRGRENLEAFVERGWMVRDARPAYYVYSQRAGEHRQVGVMGASAVDDYLRDHIKKHEHTRPEKENDRVRLNDALSAHPGPVMLTYRGLPELDALVTGVTEAAPRVRFEAPDGVEHALWVVDDAATRARIEQLFGQVGATYVADGHHRAAAAARVSTQRRKQAPGSSTLAPFNYFLTVLFPAEQLRVLDYNRVVKDLNGLTPEVLLDRVRGQGFVVDAPHPAKRPPRRGSFGMYLAGRWYLLSASPGPAVAGDVVGSLDAATLSRSLLAPVLGVGDLRTDRRIDFVGGSRGMEELERRVDSGEAAVAFALYPTSLEDVMSVADSGHVMPPKSTWFEPKLRSGLVVQPFDGDTL